MPLARRTALCVDEVDDRKTRMGVSTPWKIKEVVTLPLEVSTRCVQEILYRSDRVVLGDAPPWKTMLASDCHDCAMSPFHKFTDSGKEAGPAL